MQTLNGEKQALWKAWRRKNQSEWQTALECSAIGQHWSNIKTIIKARRKAGERITVAQWSEANAPVTHRWLDEFSGFADRWEEFRAAWKWAQTSPYPPERRPGLHGFVDLINTKAKLEHVRGERALHRSEKSGPANAGMQILQGDCLAVLRTLPSRSIQTCLTSSPLGGDLKDKDLIGISWMLAFALRADRWYLRSDMALGSDCRETSGCGTAKMNWPFTTAMTSCPVVLHQIVPSVALVGRVPIVVLYEPSKEVMGGGAGGSLRIGPIGPAQPPKMAARATACGLTKRRLIARSPDRSAIALPRSLH